MGRRGNAFSPEVRQKGLGAGQPLQSLGLGLPVAAAVLCWGQLSRFLLLPGCLACPRTVLNTLRLHLWWGREGPSDASWFQGLPGATLSCLLPDLRRFPAGWNVSLPSGKIPLFLLLVNILF